MCMNRQMVRSEPLNTVEDIHVMPVKTDKGYIIGYVANITFIGDAKKIQIYQARKNMRDDCSKIIADFQELSMFILGRDATDNYVRGRCDCSMGGCYCVCCNNWGLVTLAFIILSACYVGLSFLVAKTVYNNNFD